MERRREPRISADQPARVTILAGGGEAFDAIILNLSGRGLKLHVPGPVAVNAPIRVDVADMLLVGDVCYCRRQQEGWVLGVALAHCIYEMSALAELMQRLTEDSAVPEETQTPHLRG